MNDALRGIKIIQKLIDRIDSLAILCRDTYLRFVAMRLQSYSS